MDWTKNNGEIVDRRYVKQRAVQEMVRWKTVYSLASRRACIARTVEDDEWMRFRNGMVVAAVVRDVVDDLLSHTEADNLTMSDTERHAIWKRELVEAKAKPRVLTPDDGELAKWLKHEACCICQAPSSWWLMPENAPMCSEECLERYLKDPTIYDPRGLYPRKRKRNA